MSIEQFTKEEVRKFLLVNRGIIGIRRILRGSYQVGRGSRNILRGIGDTRVAMPVVRRAVRKAGRKVVSVARRISRPVLSGTGWGIGAAAATSVTRRRKRRGSRPMARIRRRKVARPRVGRITRPIRRRHDFS